MLSATVEIRECTLEGVDDGHTSASDTSALIEKIDGKVEGEKEQEEEEEEETKKTTTTMTTTTTRRKEWMETEKKMFDFDYPRPKNEGKGRKAVTSSIPVWPCLWCCCAPIGRMTICCVCRSRSEEVPDFICCVLGACWPVSMFWTSIIILVPGVIFLTLGSKLPLPVNIVGIAIQLITLFAFCSVAFGDPGIFPRYELPPDGDIEDGSGKEKENVIEGKTSAPKKTMTKWRYCEKARGWRPPGVKYCSESAVLVKRLDHFCPVIGNAIGKRNMWAFKLLLCTHGVLVYYTLGVFVTGLVKAFGGF